MTNPSRLTGPASALACGQCHSVWAFNNMDTRSTLIGMAESFVPVTLTWPSFCRSATIADHTEQKEFIRQSEPDYFSNRFWGDGMIRVTGREFNGIEASPCFRGGNFSCLSCHEMHLDDPQQVSLLNGPVADS